MYLHVPVEVRRTLFPFQRPIVADPDPHGSTLLSTLGSGSTGVQPVSNEEMVIDQTYRYLRVRFGTVIIAFKFCLESVNEGTVSYENYIR